jgi:hypothetical protein
MRYTTLIQSAVQSFAFKSNKTKLNLALVLLRGKSTQNFLNDFNLSEQRDFDPKVAIATNALNLLD